MGAMLTSAGLPLGTSFQAVTQSSIVLWHLNRLRCECAGLFCRPPTAILCIRRHVRGFCQMLLGLWLSLPLPI